jgi:predicted nuclease of restriction endonuclease-like (RecB) superfamily
MNFETLIQSITGLHHHFHQQAVKAVNVHLTLRNWLVGYYIVEFEQEGDERAAYGDKLLAKLALRCKAIKGFDERSFRNFRLFYLRYPQLAQLIAERVAQFPILGSVTTKFTAELIGQQSPIRGSATAELQNTDNQLSAARLIERLSYTHLEQLIAVEDATKRAFYETECMKGTWSVRELKRQIASLYYERSSMSRKPELLAEITQQGAENNRVRDLIKSVYTFEFLGLNPKDAVEESDLETALLDHLQSFILEMGHGFCLEARQKKILIGDEYFFVDLVFYHRILKCHVLVELKVEEFNHTNAGQLNTYLNYYKAEVQQPDDNLPVGILLVTDKNKALVEYATAGIDNQLFVSKYLLALPGKEVLEAFIQNELQQLT